MPKVNSLPPTMVRLVPRTNFAPSLAHDQAKIKKFMALHAQIQKSKRTPEMKPVEGFIDLTGDEEDSKLMPPLPPPEIPMKRPAQTFRRIRLHSMVVVREAYSVATTQLNPRFFPIPTSPGVSNAPENEPPFSSPESSPHQTAETGRIRPISPLSSIMASSLSCSRTHPGLISQKY